MREYILNASASDIILAGLLFFAISYCLAGLISSFLTLWLLPSLRIGKKINTSVIPAGQLKRELALSLMSIVIFGAGVIFPWALLQLGWARLAIAPSFWQIILEILALIAWNELHFYINHRLLHTRFLRRFHRQHHLSIITTPWTAYCFHPLETLMLGGVPLLPMLLHDFSLEALVFLPLFSLLINSMGHSNYDFAPGSQWFIFKGVRRHHLHHARFNGNYGFMLPLLDRMLGTALPEKSDTDGQDQIRSSIHKIR